MGTDGSPRFISGSELQGLLPKGEAVDALERGLLSRGEDWNQAPRAVVEHEHGDFLLMPATGPEGAGAKLVTVVPGNAERGLPLINGLYVLFSNEDLVPELLIDGGALTELRTAALSALAARHLARPQSRTMVVFGAGVQARAHARMMREVLPLEAMTIVARSKHSERAAELVGQLRDEGVEARLGSPEDVAAADVVCTCTTSATPVFDSALLEPGTHVSAVGSYKPETRELDLALLERALLVVETRAVAGHEAGDVIQAIEAGVLAGLEATHELIEVLRGEVKREGARVSVFKSVGLPVEDLIVARAAADRLAELGGRPHD